MLDLKEMRVLIVDDMENMCKSIRGMMKVMDYGKDFFYAYNGKEALSVFEDQKINFVICDWNMPVMTGVEMISRMKEDRNLRDIPVIMVTAEANDEIVAEAAESDVNAYLLKPLTIGSLEKKIKEVAHAINNPTPMILHLKQARIYEEKGNLADAIKEARLATDCDPQSSKPIRELAYYLYQHGQLGEAEEKFSKAAQLNKLDVFANHYLGEINLQRGDIDSAILHFNKAMTISPRHVSRALEFGKLLMEKDLKEKAAIVFDKALDVSTTPSLLREELIPLCLAHNMNKYAIKLMKKVIDDAPQRNDIRLQLGLTYRNINDLDAALSTLSLAASREKENVSIKLIIAKIYLSQKQQLRAERVLREALILDQNNREIKELLRQCI